MRHSNQFQENRIYQPRTRTEKQILKVFLEKNERATKTALKRKYFNRSMDETKSSDCNNKIKYGSESAAIDFMSRNISKYGAGEAYYCEEHNCWHLTYSI